MGQNDRLLFVAHREEILAQSLETFRGVLKDVNFGEMFTGNHHGENPDYAFISIQTINSKKLYDLLDSDYYAYIIVDEFHHAAAESYQKLLQHFKPKVLLGLTATPERMDGQDILKYFDGRIAAEIRLPEAIDRKLLCPFQYFGISDIVDLSEVRWTRGGYDAHELDKVYVFAREVAKKRAQHIIQNIVKYTTSVADMKALGFCVSRDHAKFMADFFNENGIPAMALDSNTSRDDREAAKGRLISGEIKVIFVVDLYNEGVDITCVNTVLFLRPTESLTVFLQQLGRGLRLDESKECLTVLDFIGQANKKYNYEEKFAALLSNTRHSVEHELKHGFVSVPKGCYIQLEKIASKYVLDNIKGSIETRAGLLNKIRTFEEDTGKELTLMNFLQHYHLDARRVYKTKLSFARLCVLAGAKADFDEPMEDMLTKALPRLASLDSRRVLSYLINALHSRDPLSKKLTDARKRMLQMFYVTVWQNSTIDFDDSKVAQQRFADLANSPVMQQEIIELLQYRLSTIDFIDKVLSLGAPYPLDLHCTYSRDQLLVALDFMKPWTVREGVKWLPDKGIDVLFVTLNKSDKDYSPTTMYDDYSINETLFHWQSQSTTSEGSKTGQRYIHHKEQGSKVLLCVRDYKKDEWGNAAAYTVLGFASYVQHTGSSPMSITWLLDDEIPAKYIKQTKKTMVG